MAGWAFPHLQYLYASVWEDHCRSVQPPFFFKLQTQSLKMVIFQKDGINFLFDSSKNINFYSIFTTKVNIGEISKIYGSLRLFCPENFFLQKLIIIKMNCDLEVRKKYEINYQDSYGWRGTCTILRGNSGNKYAVWDSENEGWNERESEMLKQVFKWEVRHLHLFNNQQATLLKEINHVQFTNLTCLALWGNQIESVEGITRISMPFIQEIFLNNNYIRSVKVFRKAARWLHVTEICISQNYIEDPRYLTQGQFPLLARLVMYFDSTSQRDKNKSLDYCFAFKLRTESLKYLSIKKAILSANHSINKNLEEKWKQLWIK